MPQGRLAIRLGIIGAGSMAEALIQGLVARSIVAHSDIRVTNRHRAQRLSVLAARYGVEPCASVRDLVLASDVLVVAVKPKDVPEALAPLRGSMRPDQLVISVAAGITTRAIEAAVGDEVPVVRAMPNTPSSVGEGATALAPGRFAGPEHLELAQVLFAAVGEVVVVEEELLDGVTGLSGSGPAYVFLMMECMIEAGIGLGLSREVAHALAVQTVLGAAKLARVSGEHPEELRLKVTSPGGTTAAAMSVLEERGFRQALIAAIQRAAERAAELGGAVRA